MLTHAIAHLDSGREIPSRTADSNPRQYKLIFELDTLPTELTPHPSSHPLRSLYRSRCEATIEALPVAIFLNDVHAESFNPCKTVPALMPCQFQQYRED